MTPEYGADRLLPRTVSVEEADDDRLDAGHAADLLARELAHHLL